MKKFLLTGCLAVLLCCLISPAAEAQCAMCGATVNTASAEGNMETNGLNSGILYMLATPFLVVMGIGFLWYKKYRKKNIIMNVEDTNISLN